ncbi:MAG: hypothetical protein V7K40_25805 [Nostoc sp.]|uniref:hypothetical protein n=1 Tax=Nostoc sp. TaxID=1180 RepID=UPI002FF8507D
MYSKADSNRQIRLGLLVPAGNTTFEPDFHCAFSSQVSVHSHRLIAQRSHASENYESMDDINEEAVKEVEKLARARYILEHTASQQQHFTEGEFLLKN